jgi:sortase A
MSKGRRVLYLLLLVVVLTGGILVLKSGVIYGKAQLAQYLLWQAWQVNQLGQQSQQKAWFYADGYPVAQLTIEQTKQTFVVLNEASNRNLAFAPGIWHHASNNTIIAAHNDTHFRFISEAKVGQKIRYLAQTATEQSYQIEAIIEVDYRDTDWLFKLADHLILITCKHRSKLDTAPTTRQVIIARKTA